MDKEADVHPLIQQYLLSDYHLSGVVPGVRDTLVNNQGGPALMNLIFWQQGEDSHYHGGGPYT